MHHSAKGACPLEALSVIMDIGRGCNQMEYIVTSSEMKRCDTYTIEKIGVPAMVLMERAALSAMEELCDGSFDLKQVLVVCGGGNNGGDGFALARLLHLQNIAVSILFVGNKDKLTPETRQQMKIAENYGIKIDSDIDFTGFTTIVDALFGIGLDRKVEGRYANIIEKMNQSQADILALDIPSGISADTGKIMGISAQAKKTITFGYKKIGLVLYPGAKYAGIIKTKDIGIKDVGFNKEYPKICSYTYEDLKKIPRRNPYSNKGTFGKVLIMAGSVNMSGAAYFSAKAAYRMGAGLVRIYTLQENRQILQTMLPEAILTTYDENDIEIEVLKQVINWANVIVMGPGSGQGPSVALILKHVLENAKVPLVIDADGINCIARDPNLLKNHQSDIILTPHLGEMARLTRKSIPEIAENLIQEAESYAKKHHLVCVLKDTRTVVTDGKDGVYLNQSGNNGMATGGSGDVLTGIIAALLAQGVDLLEAARLGVYIHGLAGDSARSKLGAHSMMANDLIDHIKEIMK